MSAMAEPRRHWRPSLAWIVEVIAFNEALAVPIALMTYSNGGGWIRSLVGASTYTQIIGSLCFFTGALLEGRWDWLSTPRRLALSFSINIVLALIGGTLAGLALAAMYGGLSRYF